MPPGKGGYNVMRRQNYQPSDWTSVGLPAATSSNAATPDSTSAFGFKSQKAMRRSADRRYD
jgi:hypothetical protein